MVTDKDTEGFRREGVAFLAGAFERKWIDRLRQGGAENIASPSERGRLWDQSMTPAIQSERGHRPTP